MVTNQNFSNGWRLLKNGRCALCCSLERKWEKSALCPRAFDVPEQIPKWAAARAGKPSTQQQNHQTFNDLGNYPQWACLMASRGRHQTQLARLHRPFPYTNLQDWCAWSLPHHHSSHTHTHIYIYILYIYIYTVYIYIWQLLREAGTTGSALTLLFSVVHELRPTVKINRTDAPLVFEI